MVAKVILSKINEYWNSMTNFKIDNNFFIDIYSKSV